MHVRLKDVELFLQKRFGEVKEIKHLADGWWSQAFSFTSTRGKLVLRISAHPNDFLKDKFAYQSFNSSNIPIVKILEIGQFDKEFHYCLSSFCAGTTSDDLLESLDYKTALVIAPTILEPLYHIHNLDVSTHNGFGLTDTQGNGGWKTWPDYLLSMHNHKYPISWQELGNTTWLDPILFGKLHHRMQEFFVYLPKKKSILHGDYGFDNLLLNDNHEVTAVLDWAEMLLGDEMYDLIHMNEPWEVQIPDISYLSIWKQQKESQQIEIPYFEQRLECYRIHYTLFHLHIHSARKEEEEYTHIAQWAGKYLL